MSSDVTARLEAVAARLERVASRLGGGGGGDDDDEVPFYVTDYEAIVKKEVKAAIDATNKLGIPKMGDLLKQAYDNNLELIRRVPNTKKPSPQELAAFLKPGIDAITAADNQKYKGKEYKKFGDMYKAMYESIVAVSWVTMAPPMGLPAQHAEGQKQSCDFNLMRVQKNNKTQACKDWMAAMKAMNKKVAEYVKSSFKGGLTWNPKGKPLGDAAAVSSSKDDEKQSAASTKKKTTTKKSGGGGGGMDALFGALNKGTGITKGMKKVTKDMKTKYRKDRTGKVEVKAVKKKGRKKYGPPQTKFTGGRWMVENYEEGIIPVDKATARQTVFISMCDNCVVQVPAKVKAVTIDNCVKVRVFVTEVISTVEIVNCKSVKLIVQTKSPSVTVDKCESVTIILTRSAYENCPDIYTSNISAMNVEIPGKTDDDDPKELPVPEQFLTKIDPKTGKMTTTNTEH